MEKTFTLAEATWRAIERQTKSYTGLSLAQMEELLSVDGGEQLLNNLPITLQVWLDTQYSLETKIFKEVYNAHLTINGLMEKFKETETYQLMMLKGLMEDDLPTYMAHGWHLLHYGE